MPAKLDQTTITADHIATLSITNSWIYGGGLGSWQLRKQVLCVASTATNAVSSSAGIFPSMDLSLATIYQVRIIDTNYSVTNMLITVLPSALSNVIETAPYAADPFCVSNAPNTACPDGTIRLPSTLVQVPIAGALANGTDNYLMTMMARDRYGNRITTGTMDIKYTTPIKNIQTLF